METALTAPIDFVFASQAQPARETIELFVGAGGERRVIEVSMRCAGALLVGLAKNMEPVVGGVQPVLAGKIEPTMSRDGLKVALRITLDSGGEIILDVPASQLPNLVSTFAMLDRLMSPSPAAN